MFAALLLLAVGGDVATFAGPTMGGKYRVQLVTPAGPGIEPIQRQTHQRLGEINLCISTYLPQSELSRLNASESTDWIDVSPKLAMLADYALRLAADSGGAFDPTLGPVVNAWGFGPTPPTDDGPTDDQLRALRKRVGYQRVAVRLDPPAIRKEHADMQLDLSAIGQGYGADVVHDLLVDLGATSFLVDITGEIRTRGAKPAGSPWRVAVELPPELEAVHVDLAGGSIATSGSTHNFFERDGRRFAHLIDPRTCRPIEHHLVSCTVRSEKCLDADAWATTLMILGPDKGLRWANERNIAALLLVADGDGYDVLTTKAWRRQTQQ